DTLMRAGLSSVSGKRFAFDRGESLLDLVRERSFLFDELVREGTCALEQRPVAPQVRELQIGQARLPRAEQLSAAAKLEIDFRQLESVRRRDESLEPRDGRVGELFARARDQEAVRLLSGTSDSPAQLMQLRETETIRFLHDHDRRVRDVDADLDHGRRDEDVELAGLELRHQLT